MARKPGGQPGNHNARGHHGGSRSGAQEASAAQSRTNSGRRAGQRLTAATGMNGALFNMLNNRSVAGGPLHPKGSFAAVNGVTSAAVSARNGSTPKAVPMPKASPAGRKVVTGPTNAQKISNAATMFGTGSRQHLAAKKRFGG